MRPALRTRDFLSAAYRDRGGYGHADRAQDAARFPAEAQAVYEIQVRPGGPWVKTGAWIFRSWTGGRRINGVTYTGPVFVLGSGERHS